MEFVVPVLLFLLGLVCIVKGGDWFVDSAAWLAEVTGIPKFIIGATIVSVATTLPELIVSVMAALEKKVDMAVGNAVGSVIANTGLILALSLLFIPCAVNRKQFKNKALLLIAACAALLLFCLSGQVTLWAGLILLAVFLLYIGDNLRQGKADSGGQERTPFDPKAAPRRILFFILGAAGIVIGARLLVDNGSLLAEMLGVPENIIALTFVAIGTSLPELVTAITAIVKKQSSLSIGNIVGANIIDLTLILPVCALISGGSLPVNDQTWTLDLPVCLAFTLIAMVPALVSGRLRRWQGVVLLVGYAAYLAVMILL